MLTKIIFRTSLLLLLSMLFACVPDESEMLSLKTEPLSIADGITDNQPEVAATPVPVGPGLAVGIAPYNCLVDGVNLWAVNMNRPGFPPFSQPNYTVEWYKNGTLFSTGAQLSDCICGEIISVRVKDSISGMKGTAVFTAKPCKTTSSSE